MADGDHDIEGPGFAVVRPRPAPLRDPMEPFEPLVAPVGAFLARLETVCVVACCGLEAYGTTEAEMRAAVAAEDGPDLAGRLRAAAVRAAASTTDLASVEGGGVVPAGEAARWLEGLAATVERLEAGGPDDRPGGQAGA